MTKLQLVAPAQLGRKQRIEELRMFVEANRKSKNEKQIIALYSLNTGLRPNVVKGYLRLFYEAGFYIKPKYLTNFMIVTPSEYEELQELKQREEQRKNEELDLDIH